MDSLKKQFEEYIHMPYDEYWELKQSKNNTVDDRILMSLINICTDTDDISAAKMSFDRLDGMLETPVVFKIPKFYVRYPNAKGIEDSGQKQIGTPETSKSVRSDDYDPATAKLRETLKKMRSMPEGIIPAILGVKKIIQEGKTVELKPPQNMPQVKHVMVANLLRNVRKKRFKAIELVFDQIDGKLTRTIDLMGGHKDVIIDDINTLTAPAGSVQIDGVWHYEDKSIATPFIRGFAKSNKGMELILEELDHE